MSGNYGVNVKSANNANNAGGSNSEVADMIVENEIRNHAHKLLANHVHGEYEDRILEWKKYINRVVDAERDALKSHEDILKRVINEKQKEQQRSAMFAMIALQLLAGPALSWITGVIETRIAPKLLSANRMQSTLVDLQTSLSQRPKRFIMWKSESEYNEVAAKVYGEFASNAVSKLAFDPIIAAITSVPERGGTNKSYQELMAVSLIPDNAESRDLHFSLKTRLENALADQQQKTMQQILDLALRIQRSPNIGKVILGYLYKKQPEVAKMSIRDKQTAAQRFVESIIDGHREKWAQEWLYYGNDPPMTSTDEMARKIEREIWALWILDQEFKVYVQQRGSFAGEVDSTWDEYYVEGRDEIELHPLIIDRLIELDVVFPQSVFEMMERHRRQLANPNGEKPSVSISGGVDDQQELDDLKNWAKKRQPDYLSGRIDYIPRRLQPIASVHERRR